MKLHTVVVFTGVGSHGFAATLSSSELVRPFFTLASDTIPRTTSWFGVVGVTTIVRFAGGHCRRAVTTSTQLDTQMVEGGFAPSVTSNSSKKRPRNEPNQTLDQTAACVQR